MGDRSTTHAPQAIAASTRLGICPDDKDDEEEQDDEEEEDEEDEEREPRPPWV